MPELNIAALNEDYEERGWCRVRLPDADTIVAIRDAIENELRSRCGNAEASLDRYHEFIGDAEHEDIHWHLVNFFWTNRFAEAIGRAQLPFFRTFIGPDLHIQSRPYLRIARPSRTEDNIGLHRDTYYGQSPYEVAVHVPFVNLDENSCLQFVSGSHTQPESAYKVVSLGQAAWDKGSTKHEMGYPYAPKQIEIDAALLTPGPVAVGDALVFPPSIIHGQEVNRGPITRVSVDFRVVSSFAPIKIRTDLSSRGYTPLSESAATKVARQYLKNCAAADADAAPPEILHTLEDV